MSCSFDRYVPPAFFFVLIFIVHVSYHTYNCRQHYLYSCVAILAFSFFFLSCFIYFSLTAGRSENHVRDERTLYKDYHYYDIIIRIFNRIGFRTSRELVICKMKVLNNGFNQISMNDRTYFGRDVFNSRPCRNIRVTCFMRRNKYRNEDGLQKTHFTCLMYHRSKLILGVYKRRL